MELDDILAFFNEDALCPENIKNCRSLRDAYFKEYNGLLNKKCEHCTLVSLRDKYIKIISQNE